MLLSWYKPVCLEVRSKAGENRPWAARLQGTWQGPHTWHQLTCSPPVGWTQVAEVSAGCHPEDAETARACRVGRQWGQRAAWWSLGAPPGGALPCQEDDAAPARCAVLSVSVSLSLASAWHPSAWWKLLKPRKGLSGSEALLSNGALEPDCLGSNPSFANVSWVNAFTSLCPASSWGELTVCTYKLVGSSVWHIESAQ